MELEELLNSAESDPRRVMPFDGGSFLSLALHCLMIDSGFISVDERGIAHMAGRTKFRPFPGWNARPAEWVFLYARRGAANRFRLHTALHPTTGRLFVHASELRWDGDAPLEGKICLLGLQLQNYVQVEQAASLGSAGWEGVFSNQQQLRQLFQEHVLTPLTQRADPLPGSPLALPPGVKNSAGNRVVRGAQVVRDCGAAAGEGVARRLGWGTSSGMLLVVLAGVAVAGAVVVAVKARQPLPQ